MWSIIPNIISATRIVLVYPVVVYLLERRYGLALGIFLIACASDLLDGYLARTFDWRTDIGGWLDPIADKLLLNSVYLALCYIGIVPWWLLVCIFGRDVSIVAGVIYYHNRIARLTASPTLISKLNTLVQLILVVAILAQYTFAWTQVPYYASLVNYSMWLVLGLTLVSGLGYVVIGVRGLKRGQSP